MRIYHYMETGRRIDDGFGVSFTRRKYYLVFGNHGRKIRIPRWLSRYG